MRSQLHSMHFIGPLSHIRPVAPVLLAKREFYRRVRGKSYHPKRDHLIVKDYSRQIERRLAGLDVNIILSPLSPCSQPIAYLDCVQPVVIWTDTIWAGVVDFYPEYSSKLTCVETLRNAVANERAAVSRASLAILLVRLGCTIRYSLLRSRSFQGPRRCARSGSRRQSPSHFR
jgi:hypothetical protein